MTEEKIRELIYDVLLSYNLPLTEINRENSLLKLAGPLEVLNTNIFDRIITLVNDFQAYEFLRKDREMKIKLEDIWKEECESSRRNLEITYVDIRNMVSSESQQE